MKPIRVSQLNSYIHRTLSADPVLANITVIGEVSNLKYHSNGHVYFSLKDEGARVNCFLPGQVAKDLKDGMEDGVSVVVSGYINVYEKGGSYSLNIRDIETVGTGDLSSAFERLKKKLLDEGLFDKKYKKSLPPFPKNITIITSPTGAAIEDIIKIITEKNDFVNLLIYPTLVQGKDAAPMIASGIAYVNKRYPNTDIIIVGRGGGSAEELWAFNEEQVARAIFASKIPIISAVGHETDITISDFVADVRAETPTAAADMAVPDLSDLRASMVGAKDLMISGLLSRLNFLRVRVDACRMPRLKDMLSARIELSLADARRAAADMNREADLLLGEKSSTAEILHEKLCASEPGRIMSMGYAAISSGGKSVTSVRSLADGDEVAARFADGCAVMTVKSVAPEKF